MDHTRRGAGVGPLVKPQAGNTRSTEWDATLVSNLWLDIYLRILVYLVKFDSG
jgi:hypothetical protein